jgi:hypothetical protein
VACCSVDCIDEQHADKRICYLEKIIAEATCLLSFLPIKKAPMQPPFPLSKLHKPRDFVRVVRLSTTRKPF